MIFVVSWILRAIEHYHEMTKESNASTGNIIESLPPNKILHLLYEVSIHISQLQKNKFKFFSIIFLNANILTISRFYQQANSSNSITMIPQHQHLLVQGINQDIKTNLIQENMLPRSILARRYLIMQKTNPFASTVLVPVMIE